ncbi:hypothetical protein [Fundidesulfovibrio magnetotacticus]|uniref:hypothetical protein n=1 Tax=Fundidesulfovibrio magnetotacticus TaxID=2730080 RepID=UPI0015651A1E|nr:hypothetical protein [Fundidesulfovibrio magnetotacticus]
MLATDSSELLDRLIGLLAPCAVLDTALGVREAAALAENERYDAAVWAFPPGDGLAARLAALAHDGGSGQDAAALAEIRRILEAHARDMFGAPAQPDIQSDADDLATRIGALVEEKVGQSLEALIQAEQEAERFEKGLREAIAQAEAARQETEAERAAAQRARAESERLARELEAQRKAMDEAAAGNEQAQASLREALRASRSDLDAALRSAHEQQAGILSARQEAEELRRKFAQAEAEKKSLREAADTLRAELAVRGREAEAALSRAVGERDALRRQLSEAQSRLDALQAQWEQIVR